MIEWFIASGVLEIGLKNDWALQLYYPRYTKNSYGHTLLFKTTIVVGKRAFALSFFGLGFGFAKDEFNTSIRREKIKARNNLRE